MNFVLRVASTWKPVPVLRLVLPAIPATGTHQPTGTTIPTRCATSGIRGTTKNVSRPRRNKCRGWKVIEGDRVHQGYILAKQIHKFRWYPGANVVAGRNKTLTATCTGTVRYTKEIFVPGPRSNAAKEVLNLPRGSLLYKTFINVLPDKEVGRFRLVEQI